MIEKRKHKRLDLDISVKLEHLDENGITTLKYTPVEMTDISRGGLGFQTSQKLEIGSCYDAKIEVWTKEVVDAVIKIVYCVPNNDGYKHGAVFLEMKDADALRIDIYQIFNDI